MMEMIPIWRIATTRTTSNFISLRRGETFCSWPFYMSTTDDQTPIYRTSSSTLTSTMTLPASSCSDSKAARFEISLSPYACPTYSCWIMDPSVSREREGICLVLRHLSQPRRPVELMSMFERSESMLSRMISTMLKWIKNRWAGLLFHWDHARLAPAKSEEFSAAVYEEGFPLPWVIGFVDGTVRPITRPVKN
ncbi:hypothetical protein EDD21DRAFT_98009 [Dissophora ornata]|nr:hypothetical protein EDD21DRAFT_98009 [Dissophora ornata]